MFLLFYCWYFLFCPFCFLVQHFPPQIFGPSVPWISKLGLEFHPPHNSHNPTNAAQCHAMQCHVMRFRTMRWGDSDRCDFCKFMLHHVLMAGALWSVCALFWLWWPCWQLPYGFPQALCCQMYKLLLPFMHGQFWGSHKSMLFPEYILITKLLNKLIFEFLLGNLMEFVFSFLGEVC